MSSTILDEAFDVEAEEGSPARELLPAGRYKAEVTAATVGVTKNGRGQMVNITWTVIGGDHDKRLVFQNILIQHESADAQRFGRQKFKDLCVACGVTKPVTDLDVLLYKPCLITVVVRHDKDGQYADKNEVSRIMPVVASWNGAKPATDVLREASATPKSFSSKNDPMNDEIPF